MKPTHACLVVALVCLMSQAAYSQAPVAPAELDHAALLVRDLEKSATFYEQVLGLQRILRPIPGRPILWFRVGGTRELHLIQGESPAGTHDMSVHLAFRVPSMADFKARLDKLKVKYKRFEDENGKPIVRPDGVQQIYLQDPDGYWIEINDVK